MTKTTNTKCPVGNPPPTVEQWIVRLFSDDRPLGFQAGDDNLYRYVDNDPTNATDPSGLQALPSSSRGTWVEGTAGNGVFEYSNSAQNQAAGLAGARVRFSDNSIAVGGFPESWYYGGSAATATVQIPSVSGTNADMTAATNAMRTRLNNPSWSPPEGFTWNHAGPPGSTTMELVNSRLHTAVHHQGSAAVARAAQKTPAPANRVGRGIRNGVGVLGISTSFFQACEMTGIVPPEQTVVTADYYFTEDDGSVFVVQTPTMLGRFLGNFRNPFVCATAPSAQVVYVAGPQRGRTINITDAQAEAYQQEGIRLYGQLVRDSFFSPLRFVPGTLRPTFPHFSVTPTGRRIYEGYYDETGYHRLPTTDDSGMPFLPNDPRDPRNGA